ncbi:MAG: phospholipase D-like domain-containing protein [Candidatus Micrarchaeota archaeon]|nr:phospholipase D-like domain-containing protein [Candidatus Micrarchaeota archaeon]
MGKTKNAKAERFLIAILSVIIAALLAFIALSSPQGCQLYNAKAETVISPAAQDEVVSLIRSAEKTIDIQMYLITSEEIMKELEAAAKRGVYIRIILEPRVDDKRKEKTASLLLAFGCQVKWASMSYKLTHSKMIIVDKKRALVGSINLSKNALNENREVGVIIEGSPVSDLMKVFEEDWEKATPA